jgi:hypothetical protein
MAFLVSLMFMPSFVTNTVPVASHTKESLTPRRKERRAISHA